MKTEGTRGDVKRRASWIVLEILWRCLERRLNAKLDTNESEEQLVNLCFPEK